MRCANLVGVASVVVVVRARGLKIVCFTFCFFPQPQVFEPVHTSVFCLGEQATKPRAILKIKFTEHHIVSVNVSYLEGGGTGATNFPAGMNIFLSLFSNDVEIDSRLSNVETKTQLISANSSRTTFVKSSQFIISDIFTFQISYQDGLDATPRFVVGNTQINAHIPMSMSNYKLNGIPAPTNNDDCVNTLYVDNADAANQVGQFMGHYQCLIIKSH